MIVYNLVKNKISFEGRKEFTLSREIISEFDLKKRTSLPEEEYRSLIYRACENYSYYLLGIKNYFRKELKNKLKERFYHEDICEDVVVSLEEKNYIDDYDSAKSYIACHKNYGREKLKFELIKRGASKDIIEELLFENSDSEEEELRRQIFKMEGKVPEKIIASLMRKGFNYGSIKKILGES